jgi:hypothetical protein
MRALYLSDKNKPCRAGEKHSPPNYKGKYMNDTSIYKIFFAATIFSLIILPLMLAGCVNKKSDNTLSFDATISFISLEGGFYGIIAESGEKYDPINLETEFQQDGMKVKIKARKRDDLSSFHMWGQVIEIFDIEKIE